MTTNPRPLIMWLLSCRAHHASVLVTGAQQFTSYPTGFSTSRVKEQRTNTLCIGCMRFWVGSKRSSNFTVGCSSFGEDVRWSVMNYSPAGWRTKRRSIPCAKRWMTLRAPLLVPAPPRLRISRWVCCYVLKKPGSDLMLCNKDPIFLSHIFCFEMKTAVEACDFIGCRETFKTPSSW